MWFSASTGNLFTCSKANRTNLQVVGCKQQRRVWSSEEGFSASVNVLSGIGLHLSKWFIQRKELEILPGLMFKIFIPSSQMNWFLGNCCVRGDLGFAYLKTQESREVRGFSSLNTGIPEDQLTQPELCIFSIHTQPCRIILCNQNFLILSEKCCLCLT